MRGHYLQTWYIRIDSRVAERLWILENYELLKKSPNFRKLEFCVSSACKRENFVNTSKQVQKIAIKLFS